MNACDGGNGGSYNRAASKLSNQELRQLNTKLELNSKQNNLRKIEKI